MIGSLRIILGEPQPMNLMRVLIADRARFYVTKQSVAVRDNLVKYSMAICLYPITVGFLCYILVD